MEKPKNKMIEKLKAGEMVVSAKLNITHPISASIAAMCGFDAVWVDMEHVPSDYREVNEVVLAAKAYGAETVVRVPRGCYSNTTRPLEMDASAVMVPHVMTVGEAREIARITKFHPIGRRPIDGGNADGLFGLADYGEYIRYSNEQKLTIIQIEDREAIEQIDEIAQVEGIDMLFFGPADYAHSLGIPTDLNNERVLAARRKVAETALKYGKYAGTVGSTGNVRDLYELGFRYVNLTADVAVLGRAFKETMAEYQAVLSALQPRL